MNPAIWHGPIKQEKCQPKKLKFPCMNADYQRIWLEYYLYLDNKYGLRIFRDPVRRQIPSTDVPSRQTNSAPSLNSLKNRCFAAGFTSYSCASQDRPRQVISAQARWIEFRQAQFLLYWRHKN